MNTTLKGLITSFTKSIDLYNYILKNHHRRTAIAAYHIGMAYHLSASQLSDLVIAAALHDIGALTIGERDALIQMDVENPHPHARLGYYMLESFEPFQNISKIVYYHHWPYAQDQHYSTEIGPVPIQSYILHLADRIEILINPQESILTQTERIRNKITSYSGNLFHPGAVSAFLNVSVHDSFWLDIGNLSLDTVFESAISDDLAIEVTPDLLEQFAFTLSKIIDSRSRFTISHSFGVSAVAYQIAQYVGYDEEKCRLIRIAGLLHDMGKIAISPAIIEKPGSLTQGERLNVQTHAYYTYMILKDIDALGEIRDWAANHHENHLGNGYPRNLKEGNLSEEMDIVAYADIYTALSENRPYRDSLPSEEILKILREDYVEKHGQALFDIIEAHIEEIDRVCKDSIRDGVNRYEIFEEFSEKEALTIL